MANKLINKHAGTNYEKLLKAMINSEALHNRNVQF